MKRTFVAAVAAGCLIVLPGIPALAQGPLVPSDGAAAAPAPGPGPVVVVQQPAGAPAAAPPDAGEKKKTMTQQLEDGGLGLEWLYLNADVGAAFTDLVSLRSSNWQLQDSSASGLAFGLGAGVRLVVLSAGIRVRDLQLSSFNLWETDLEAALHFRIWRFDMALGARGGYAFLGSFSADALQASTGSSLSDVTVHGWNVGPNLSLDFYLSKRVSVGVDANAEVLFLKRPPIPLQPGQTVAPQFQALYADSGSSVGAGFVGMAHLGIHF
jgi:hypothetical protein